MRGSHEDIGFPGENIDDAAASRAPFVHLSQISSNFPKGSSKSLARVARNCGSGSVPLLATRNVT